MKTAVIYARYSSERQTEQSIDGQLRVCKEYAASHDILIVDTYIDRAMTGTNDNRAAFQKMLLDSNKRAWDYVIVYKLDRFSRNKYETAVHKKTLRDNGVKLLSAMENIPDSPEGIILESLLEGMSEYYSAELSQKVKRGLKESRLKGNFTGGQVVYGYKVENKKVVIDEDKVDIVRYIFREYATGTIVSDIRQKLTNLGVLNRSKPFAINTLYNILKNEKYSGVCYFHQEKFTDIYPKIIPDEIFDIVKSKLDANHYGKRSVRVVYLLKNKVFCGYCCCHISSDTGTSQNGDINYYYKCWGRKHKHNCKKSIVKKKDLEELVINTTLNLLNTPENIANVVDKILIAHKKRMAEHSVLNILTAERRQAEKVLDNIMTAVEQGVVTETTKQRLEQLEIMIEDLDNKILIEQSKLRVKLDREDIEKFLVQAIKEQPEQMIDLLVKKIVLYDDKIQITYNYTTNTSPEDENHQDFVLCTSSINSPFTPPNAIIAEPLL